MYFDYNATAPLRESVKGALMESLHDFGNPTSVHTYGRHIRQKIENVREKIAHYFNVSPKNVIFTSGATEANAMVMQQPHYESFILSAIEHDSVFTRTSGHGDISILPVTQEGVVDVHALEALLVLASSKKNLVAVMAVNNETGVIQPLDAIKELCKKHKADLHVDAVQAFGKIHLDLKDITTVSLSAHKVGGPAGVGILIKKEEYHPIALIKGGGQERSFRSGTENYHNIIAFGAVFDDLFQDDLTLWQSYRDDLEQTFQQASPRTIVFGQKAKRIPTTLCLTMPGVKSEIQLMNFDLKGIAVSTGSACSSGKVKPSRVLQAMKYPDKDITTALRISIGHLTTHVEIQSLKTAWLDIYKRLSS